MANNFRTPARSLVTILMVLSSGSWAAGAGPIEGPTRRFGPADPPRIMPAADDARAHETALVSHRRGFYGPGRRFTTIYTPWYAWPYRWSYYSYRPWYRLYSPGLYGGSHGGIYGPVPYARYYAPYSFGYGTLGWPAYGYAPAWGPTPGIYPYPALDFTPGEYIDTPSTDCYYW